MELEPHSLMKSVAIGTQRSVTCDWRRSNSLSHHSSSKFDNERLAWQIHSLRNCHTHSFPLTWSSHVGSNHAFHLAHSSLALLLAPLLLAGSLKALPLPHFMIITSLALFKLFKLARCSSRYSLLPRSLVQFFVIFFSLCLLKRRQTLEVSSHYLFRNPSARTYPKCARTFPRICLHLSEVLITSDIGCLGPTSCKVRRGPGQIRGTYGLGPIMKYRPSKL